MARSVQNGRRGAGPSACALCPSGTFGATAGLTTKSCSAFCPPGRYTETDGAKRLSECRTCPPGFNSDQCGLGVRHVTANDAAGAGAEILSAKAADPHADSTAGHNEGPDRYGSYDPV